MKVIDNIKNFFISLSSKLISPFLPEDEDSTSLHKLINTITLVLTLIIFFITIITISIGLSSHLSKKESKLRYMEEDGIRYIELVDGYIKEELVVETGTILPDLKSYFRDDYELPSNSTVQYFENNNAINLEQFTYEKDGDYYLKGIRTINVIIFGDYEYNTTLSVIDTTAPTFTLKEVSMATDETLDLKSFVDTYGDNSEITDYTISFKDEYDLTKEGTLDVTLVVCDISNNCGEGTTKLNITAATTPSDPNGGGSTKPSGGGSTKPSGGGSTKPSSGGTTKPSGGSTKPSNGGSTKPSGGSTTKPKINTFDASKVVTPIPRTCTPLNESQKNFDLVIDHYGTTESTRFNSIKYTRDANCHYSIIEYNGLQKTTVKYAYGKFTGTAKTMLDEATYIYSTKNSVNSKYGNTLNNFLTYTNNARKSYGLNSVELNYHLNMVATMRAMELAYSGIPFENHIRPNGKKWTNLWDEYGLTTPSSRAENIAYNYGTDELAFEGLMNSKSHREAILTSMYTKMGIGRVEFNNKLYIVQIFST